MNSWLSGYSGKKILVTGASGYLGWNLCRQLALVDCEIFRTSRQALPLIPSVSARFVDHIIDVSQLEDWQDLVGEVDFVFHLAAQTSAPLADANPVQDVSHNVLPLLRLLEGCRALKKPPFVLFAGSATQFGLGKKLPVDESMPDHPASAYCLHKLMGEQYLELYSRRGWARGATLRLANVYGPGPKSGSADRGVLNQVIRNGLAGKPIQIYGQGEQIRDYVFVEDVVDAFLAIGDRAADTSGEHFIVSSGVGTTLRDAFYLVADRVRIQTGKTVDIQHIEFPLGSSTVDLRNFVGNIQKLKTFTHWTPRHSLSDGIDRTIQFIGEEK